MRSSTAVLSALATACATLSVASTAGGAAAASVRVVSQQVSFTVVNQNTSRVPCPADGEKYTVVGHLTGPDSALNSESIKAATLYLHGNAVDERLWHYKQSERYDYATSMAKRGFVSVTVTRLGYRGSGKPDGNKVCWGSEADVAHQIVQHLRAGTYKSAGQAPKVQRLALAGHSASGFVAMAEAYSFSDVDALAVVASGEFTKPRVVEAVAGMQARCVGSQDGYALLESDDDKAAADFFHDADPAVVAAMVKSRPADACGGTANAPASMATDPIALGTVEIPVLVITGEQDAFFDDPALQARLFTGSRDVESVSLPDTGHAISLDRSAPAFQAAMAKWLGARKFGSS